MAGLPKTNEPGGICVPPVIKALAPTMDCAPMIAPSKIVQFEARLVAAFETAL